MIGTVNGCLHRAVKAHGVRDSDPGTTHSPLRFMQTASALRTDETWLQQTPHLLATRLALIATVVAIPCGAQTSGEVTTLTPVCGACDSRATLEYTIRGTDTPLEGLPRGVGQDRRGRLIVWPTRRPPLVFDSRGRFLTQLGKVGVGPGEVTPVRWVVAGNDDTLRVYSNTRVNVFSGDLRHVRTYVERSTETGSEHVVHLPGGMTARLSAIVPNRSGDLSPIYLRDRTGRLIRELSPTTRPLRPSRALARAAAGWGAPLWVAESVFIGSDGYDVMLVDTLGRSLKTLRRRADWWFSLTSPRPFRLYDPSATVDRPTSSIESVREDARGRLLILTNHSAPDWKAVKGTDRFLQENYIAVLDVIDPGTGRVLQSFRAPGFARGVVSDDRFVTYREDSEGYPYVDVWRFQVP